MTSSKLPNRGIPEGLTYGEQLRFMRKKRRFLQTAVGVALAREIERELGERMSEKAAQLMVSRIERGELMRDRERAELIGRCLSVWMGLEGAPPTLEQRGIPRDEPKGGVRARRASCPYCHGLGTVTA